MGSTTPKGRARCSRVNAEQHLHLAMLGDEAWQHPDKAVNSDLD